jgi:hypothetical protein
VLDRVFHEPGLERIADCIDSASDESVEARQQHGMLGDVLVECRLGQGLDEMPGARPSVQRCVDA